MRKRTLAIFVTAAVVLLIAVISTVIVVPKLNDNNEKDIGMYDDKNGNPVKSVPATSIIQTDSYSDMEGVSISVKTYSLQDEIPNIEILWKNETPYDATYGLGYDIQKMVDGEWVSCATEDIIVPSIACIMHSGEENPQIYNLSYFDIDKGAEYRFTAECYVASHDKYETPETCKLYIEFDVE